MKYKDLKEYIISHGNGWDRLRGFDASRIGGDSFCIHPDGGKLIASYTDREQRSYFEKFNIEDDSCMYILNLLRRIGMIKI